MTKGVQAFMKGLVDYAGLFPPAALELDPAIRNYAHYTQEEDAWMLSRFIIPAGRLEELDAYEDLLQEIAPARFSILAFPALQTDAFEAAERTLQMAIDFETRHEGTVVADRFEVKVQPEVFEPSRLLDLLGAYHNEFARLSNPVRAFVEVPLMGERWEHGVEKAARAIHDVNGEIGSNVFGLKMRCGGVTADAFPSAEALAFSILMARDAGISFKATAGLHHPVRHFSDSVDAMMHGFLNVFGGAMLAQLHHFDSSAMERVLADEHPEHFSFSDEGFQWTDWTISNDELDALREGFATSFGSCSFDEPREDLTSLGWLQSTITSI